MAPAGRLPPVAGPAPGRGPRVHRVLHPLLALLTQPGQPVHRPLPRGPRGTGQRDHARARRAAPVHADAGLAARRGRLPLVLHRQVAPVPLAHPRHGGLRLRRLGRQRPALHGLGRHRRPLRPDDRLQRRPLAHGERPTGNGPESGAVLDRTLVPDRGPGQPPRRHVVPRRPARLPGAPSRRRRRHPPGARVGRLEGRRPAPRLHRPLSRGGRPTAGQLRRRPAHQARGPPAVAVGPAARPVGVHRPRSTGERGSATSTTTSTSTGWPTAAWAPCSRPSRPRGPGTTP